MLMKRSLLIAALSTVAAGSALAQSSVTVYGRLNETVERQKDGDVSSTKVVDNASRIGFKGSEDLGGGLKANFLIEHGFNADTGTANGAFWGRESWVGLSGAFGAVRLGNMGPTAAYFATADYISMHNHDTGTSSDAFYLYPGDVRNTIAYKTPTFGGLDAEVQFGLKEAGVKNTTVLAVNYVGGPLHLGLGVVNGPTTFDGDTFNKSREIGLRALYEIGAVTIGTYYARNQVDESPTAPGIEAKRNTFRVSGMFTTGALELHANVGLASKFKVNGDSIDGTDAKQFTLGANYNLSKRTKVYGFYTKVDNKENVNYYSSAAGDDFSSLAVGIRHNF
jgi:predicted porin